MKILNPITLAPVEESLVLQAESLLAEVMERLTDANAGERFEVAVHWKGRWDFEDGRDKIGGWWSVTPNDISKRGSGNSLASALADMFAYTDLTVKREQLEKYAAAMEKLRGEIAALEGQRADLKPQRTMNTKA